MVTPVVRRWSPSPLSPEVTGGGHKSTSIFGVHANDISKVDELVGRNLTQFDWGAGGSVWGR